MMSSRNIYLRFMDLHASRLALAFVQGCGSSRFKALETLFSRHIFTFLYLHHLIRLQRNALSTSERTRRLGLEAIALITTNRIMLICLGIHMLASPREQMACTSHAYCHSVVAQTAKSSRSPSISSSLLTESLQLVDRQERPIGCEVYARESSARSDWLLERYKFQFTSNVSKQRAITYKFIARLSILWGKNGARISEKLRTFLRKYLRKVHCRVAYTKTLAMAALTRRSSPIDRAVAAAAEFARVLVGLSATNCVPVSELCRKARLPARKKAAHGIFNLHSSHRWCYLGSQVARLLRQ